MTKEQIIKLVEERILHAHKMEKEWEHKWKESIDKEYTEDQCYTQYMMWWAVRVSFEEILKNIK